MHFSYNDITVPSSKSGATCTAAGDDGSLISEGCLAPAVEAAMPQPDTNNTAAITASVIIQLPRLRAANFFHKDMTVLLIIVDY
jgi:hypothetical protein